jgi:hypothetical protein
METLLKVIAVLSSGLFAGAALYITAVEHPARISHGALIALHEFTPSYKRAALLQASLAVICFLCSVAVDGPMGMARWWRAGRRGRPLHARLHHAYEPLAARCR